MTDKNQDDDNYDLPPGITLPRDISSDYPNWKKGLIYGMACGVFGALVFSVAPLGRGVEKIGYAAVGFIAGFLMLGGIMTFRPPKS
ncbi:MAG: hypothetical protein PHH77_00195 [Victivallaceae bacterium]|nr:hypothetical protein [Victivallaceae bacterium]